MARKSRQRKPQGKRPQEAPAGKTVPNTHKPWQIAAICIALAVVTVVAYQGVRINDFLTLDDYSYVLENQHVHDGVNTESIAWAFTTFDQGNWHPLTWISHMVDWKLYGKNPAGHHMTNVCLHAASAILLFLLFIYMTGYLRRSAIVAFLFALHPAHVESVAWVAERKDVLCGFFWILTLLAYAWYVRTPSWRRFALVACGFACAVMSKPMAVTLPFTLILLDFWPLRRISFAMETHARFSSDFLKLCREKWLLFIMAIISAFITFIAQRGGGSVAQLQTLNYWNRICNAAISYCRYVKITFWPHPLTAFYYYDAKNIMVFASVLSIFALILVTIVCWNIRRERPYCLIGWLWFLGTLTPVIGFVQVGDQAMAERYLYVPIIGLLFAAVWLIGDAVANSPKIKVAAQVLAVVVIAACAVKTYAQVKVWKDAITLFSHTVEIDPRGELPNSTLAGAYARQLKCAEAQQYFDRALEYYPPWSKTLSNSAFCLMQISMRTHDRTNLPIAGQRIEQALRAEPDNYDFLTNMALWSFLMGKPQGEEMYCRKAIAVRPDALTARLFLADALQAQNKLDEAIQENRQILAIDPRSDEAHYNLGVIFDSQGLTDEALKELRLSLAIKPDQALTHYKIGRIFMKAHRLPEAVEELNQTLRFDPQNSDAHNDLGAVMIQLGDYGKAVEQFGDAVKIDPTNAGTRRNLEFAQIQLNMKLKSRK